jgi:hypothetical protein
MTPRIDCTTDETAHASIERLVATLPPEERAQFREDLIVVVHEDWDTLRDGNDPNRKRPVKFWLRRLDGRTVDDVRLLAQAARLRLEADEAK